MKVFTDFHHEGLLHSLILLFEKRLGFELYRPVGMEWYQEGYWHVFPHIDTAKQYLEVASIPTDGSIPLNEPSGNEDGIFLIEDKRTGYFHRGMTFDRFKQEKFDIIIASLPQHIEPFKKLISLYQPQAKLIFQIGNAWNIPENADIKNVLASANIPNHPNIPNFVTYHQEFDLDTFSFSTPDIMSKKIYSFINCLNTVEIYKRDWELFLELERLLPGWEFKSYGGQCRDGSLKTNEELAEKMQEAAFIFQVKSQGDGYGHIIHNAAAIGRALITRASDYQGKLAQPLIDESTSILVDSLTPEQIAHEIKIQGYPGVRGVHINQKFKKVVNFGNEEQEIRRFLQNLQ
jgi:hypothetical protein